MTKKRGQIYFSAKHTSAPFSDPALTARLERKIARWGGDLCGVADAGPLRGIETIPADLLDPFTRAVSIAVRVLTDAPLAVDGPAKNRCGSCTACRDACPAGAIRGVGTKDRYASREEALVFGRCRDRLTQENAKLPDVGVPICGVCIKVCPSGRARERRTVKQ